MGPEVIFVYKESVFYSAHKRGILKILKEDSNVGFFYNDLNEKERNKALGTLKCLIQKGGWE